MLLFANEEPTSVYGIVALVITAVVGPTIPTVIAYLQWKGKQDAESRVEQAATKATETKAKADNWAAKTNEVYSQWKEIVAAMKLERDTLREDYKQRSIELMNAMVEVQTQKAEIAQLRAEVQRLRDEIAKMKGGTP